MNQKMVIGAVVLSAVTFSLGRFSSPKKVEVKEVEKIVYVEKEKKEREQNVKETEKETRLPDGTIITERTKTKETQTKTESQIQAQEDKTTSRTTESQP